MTRTRKLLLLATPLVAAGAISACGSEEISTQVADSQYKNGATIFSQRCSGCHSLDVAGAQGGSANVRTRERTDGPNFNVRVETKESVLYAIRNGGYSGAIMPQNIVTGQEADEVADFLAKYAGQKRKKTLQVPTSTSLPAQAETP